MRARLSRIGPAFLGIAVAAVLLVATLGIGTTAAAAPAASTPANAANSPVGVGKLGLVGRLERRTVLADLTVVGPKGVVQHMRLARGPIETIGADSLTLSLASGEQVVFALSNNTIFRTAGHRVTVGDFKIGERVLVVAQADAGGYTARLVRPLLIQK
jgi:hypothetical protein